MNNVTMESKSLDQLIKIITKLILTNQQKVIREEDLKNLSKGFDFEKIMSEVYLSLKKVGFELIKTNFMEQKFYILTSDGKDDNITPSQYGTLALIIALSKEVDENIKINDLKEIFGDIWSNEIQFLINNNFLREFDDLGIIRVSPLGKAAMKNIYKDLKLIDLLNVFKNE
ncbi:unnamed protein product [marine sediment metagenome]|uniref:MAGE domain-containing protein n=1 Tax=marine sediment metagenome TaxID=412755 RepID=X0UUE5_9ZZZZ